MTVFYTIFGMCKTQSVRVLHKTQRWAMACLLTFVPVATEEQRAAHLKHKRVLQKSVIQSIHCLL